MYQMATDIITVLFVSVISSCLTSFWVWTIGSPHTGELTIGRIFSCIGVWLENKSKKRDITIHNVSYKKAMENLGYQRQIKARMLNYYKALGMCYYCTNPWITLAVFTPVFVIWPVSYFIWVIPSIGIGHVLLQRFIKP